MKKWATTSSNSSEIIWILRRTYMCVYCMCLFFSSHLWLFVCTCLSSTNANKILIQYHTIVFFSLLSHWSKALPSALFIFSYGIYSGLFSSNTGVIEEFCCILGEFSHILARDREDKTSTKDEWAAITCGENLWWFSARQAPCICKYGSSLVTTCYRWRRGNMQFSRHATCGCGLHIRITDKATLS